jgi:hypothetical protein
VIHSPAQQTYRQAYLYRVVLGVIGFGLAAVFIGIGSEGSQPSMIIGAVLAIATAAGIYLMGGMLLTIHQEGVRVTKRLGSKELEWHEVKEYRYRAVPAQAGAHAAGGLVGAIAIAAARKSMGPQATTSFYLTLIAHDGRKLSIGSSFRDSYEAIGQIVNRVHERLRPNVEKSLAAGAIFGPLRLSTRAVQFKEKDPIPLQDLVRAELRGQQLDIKKQGKMLSSVNIRSDKVPNVLLFVETMDKLRFAGQEQYATNPQSRVVI